MSLEARLDTLHSSVRERKWLRAFAWFNRLVLALAFTPAGLTKLMGHRFTSLAIDTPVGFFFEALYRTGFYWRFLGAAQLVAAVLLLLPRTHPLGAVLYFPIALNVFLITLSMHFQGTPFVTGAMLLASTYLMCWHYDAWKGLLFPPRSATQPG
jgi:uncharacterized membrane protein YphA (DoxX/SURF4 family)